MSILVVLVLFSSLSFFGYGIAYFTSMQMKNEFKRFGLEKFGSLTAILELLGAAGLVIGLKYPPILLLSSGGLSILMILGVATRIKIKDSIRVSLPAVFYMALNAAIFLITLYLFY